MANTELHPKQINSSLLSGVSYNTLGLAETIGAQETPDRKLAEEIFDLIKDGGAVSVPGGRNMLKARTIISNLSLEFARLHLSPVCTTQAGGNGEVTILIGVTKH